MTIHDLHFTRPFWLIALMPVIGLLYCLPSTAEPVESSWIARVKRLLLTDAADFSKRWIVSLFAMAWVVGALAGPDWQSVEQPGHESPDPTIMLISLSQTMNATDQSPTRLVAAIHKASEILKEIDDGQVGLIVYADQPFIAVPPTDDDKVIDDILTQVSTDLVTEVNNRLDFAINQAVTLLQQANASGGQILVLADNVGVKQQKSFDAASNAKKAGFPVSSILFGSESGAVVRDHRGREVVDDTENPVMSMVDAAGLRKLATVGGGTSSSGPEPGPG